MLCATPTSTLWMASILKAFDVTAHEEIAGLLQSPLRVVLNHFTMLRCRSNPHLAFKTPISVMNMFKSSVAFTGDIHKARHDAATYSEDKSIESCFSTPLSASLNVTRFSNSPGSWHEIVTPTCNYRMGVSNMGFTVASFAKSGSVDVLFLWLPGRFGYLFLYLFLLIFIVVQFVYFKFGMGRERLKPVYR